LNTHNFLEVIMVRSRLAVALGALLLTATVASAQTSTVTGRVAKSQGGVIANAEATMRALPPARTATTAAVEGFEMMKILSHARDLETVALHWQLRFGNWILSSAGYLFPAAHERAQPWKRP
jgi:ABC-type branched-subunit amino acid transport system ATPase component